MTDIPECPASIWVQYSDNGLHIRKWATSPFDGAREYCLATRDPGALEMAFGTLPFTRVGKQILANGFHYADAADETAAEHILNRLSSRLPAEQRWRGIESAPKDGTRIFAAKVSRWRSESRVETVWWQPEFDAFISGAREMQMHNGYTFADGSTRQLHSPDIFEATHWLCEVPALPAYAAPAEVEAGR